MSSIKRDVKKKLLPRPESEGVVLISSPLSMRFARGVLWMVCPSHGCLCRRRQRQSGVKDFASEIAR
jgi:hypothetical protein